MGVLATVNSPIANLEESTASEKLKLNMSSKDRPSIDEREEGEIIDDYEDIISSDEEFSMRQRIQELEAKNAELEKIANISGVYLTGSYDYTKKDSSSHQNDRYPLISIDISDDEDYPPAPPMMRIAKRQKPLQHSCSRRRMIHTSSSSSHRHRKKSSSPPPAPLYRASDKLLLSMFHERVSTHSSHSSRRKRKSKKSHSTKSSRRKSREYNHSDSDGGDYYLDNCNVDVDDSYENFNSSDYGRSYSLNRDELRVALARSTHRNEQHVSLKERLIRRKENTDTLNEKTKQDQQEIVEEESKSNLSKEKVETEDNLEEQELRIIALKSAVIRKHLVRKKRNENVAYSPSDFDEIYANITASSSLNNIDHAEACNSMEISPVPSPKMILSEDEGMDTKPVDMDIVNSDSDCELPSYEKWIPIEHIPLPNSMEMTGELYVPTPLRYNDGEGDGFIPADVKFGSASGSVGNLDSEVEEEEVALRALLLAKMNSPKVNKSVKLERPIVEEVRTPDPDVSLEAEVLRDFLINNMKKRTQPKHSSASVLKEAVRRLTARNTCNSPAESVSETAEIQKKLQLVPKTAEETEIDLGLAISDMARVQIGVKSTYVKNEFSAGRTGDKKSMQIEVVLEELNAADDLSIKETLVSDEFDSEKENISQDPVGAKEGDFETILTEEVATKECRTEEAVVEQTLEPCCSGKAETQNQKENFESIPNEEFAENKIENYVCEGPTQEVVSVLQDNDPQVTATTTNIEENSGKEVTCDSNVEFSTPLQEEKNNSNAPAVNIPPDLTSKSKLNVEPIIPKASEKNEHTINIKSQDVVSTLESSTTLPLNIDQKSQKITSEKLLVHKLAPLKATSKSVMPKNTNKNIPQTIPVKEKKIKKKGKEDPPQQVLSETTKNSTTKNSTTPLPTLVKVETADVLVPLNTKPSVDIRVPVNRKPTVVTKKILPAEQVTKKPTPKVPTQQLTTSLTKIVKPNKVINKQTTTDLKRKPTENVATSLVPTKKIKIDNSSNRLITAAEMPLVKKLIIQLRASDTESEYSALSADDYADEDGENCRVRSFINQSISIGNEYYDIASPMSLIMESPCDTPSRTASPVVSVTPTTQQQIGKSIVNDFFEAKLDQFLKNVRSKVADSTKTKTADGEVTPLAVPVVNTPVAVRHLPEASQQEYRRLINRMKMLERQKQAKNVSENVNENGHTETVAILGEARKDSDTKTLVKKVLVKNATVNLAQPESEKMIVQEKLESVTKKPTVVPIKSVLSPNKVINQSSSTNSSTSLKPSNENLLSLYENYYRNTGTSIIANLDKSIELVLVAKEAKMAKLKHEYRLKELRKEMEEVQRNLQVHQERITKIYPEICNSHRTIESLKTRRVKINKAVTTLGRSVIGPSYSMNNDQKSIISEKSKKLAAKIKFVNNMKLTDVEKWQDPNRQNSLDDGIVVDTAKVTESLPGIKNVIQKSKDNKKMPVSDCESHAAATITLLTIPVPEVTPNKEPIMSDTIVPETVLSKEEEEDAKDSTNGYEEALETEPVGDKQVHDPHIVGGTCEEGKQREVGGAKLQDYVSPLSHLRDERQINPNGIVCPYQLMGQCDDKDCKYMHLDDE